MKSFKFLLLVCLASSCTLANLSSAHAEDFAYRQALDSTSRSEGIGESQVALLQRADGPGKSTVAEALVEKFKESDGTITTEDIEEITEDSKRILARGNGWTLQVFGDGTQVKYWNHQYIQSSNNPRVEVDDRFTNTQLEQMGREFIKERLADHIKLGPNEKLVPFSTKYHIRSGQSTSGGSITRHVMSSAVVFSRTVNGVDIVGPGSKVVVIFANDGTPAGFEFEWPEYHQTGNAQQLLSIDEISERTSAMSTMRRDVDEINLKRFECGYYDTGVRHRDSKAPVQPACISHYVARKVVSRPSAEGGSVKEAVADAVPIGESVEPDTSWPQAMYLCNGGDVCESSSLASELPTPATQ